MQLAEIKAKIYTHFDHFFSIIAKPQTEQFQNFSTHSRWCYAVQEPIYNGFLLKEGFEKNWQEIVDFQVQFFQKQKLPSSCFIAPNSQLDRIGEYLKQLGYHTPGPYQAISLDLSLPLTPSFQPIPSVKQVLTDKELKKWSTILATVFFPELKETLSDFLYENYKKLGYTGPMRHYLGYVDAKPVGASSLLLTYNSHPEICGLWNGAVLKEWRRKGVGRAMAEKRIVDAQDLGFSLMVCFMEADALAWSYCKPLGFEVQHLLHPYFSK